MRWQIIYDSAHKITNPNTDSQEKQLGIQHTGWDNVVLHMILSQFHVQKLRILEYKRFIPTWLTQSGITSEWWLLPEHINRANSADLGIFYQGIIGKTAKLLCVRFFMCFI